MIKKRYLYIDLLNCFAIFSVLMLHSSQFAFSGPSSSARTIVCKVIQAIFIPAVYIFIMNSGAMLISYRDRYSTKEFLIKRVKRVVIPLLVWSIIYYLYDIQLKNLEITASPGPIPKYHPSLRNFINCLLGNNINNTFWFFYIIILIYLTLPIISLAAKNHRNYLFFMIVISFFMNDFADWLGPIVHLKLTNKFFAFALFTFLPYSILGYLFKEKYLTRQQENLIIASGLICLAMSLFNAILNGHVVFFKHVGPMLYSCSIYLLLMRLSNLEEFNKPRLRNMFKNASICSLSMYVLHPMIYQLFDSVFHINLTSWAHIILMPLVVYPVFTLLLFYIRRIKIGKLRIFELILP